MRGRCLVNGTLVGVALQFTASVLPSGSLLQTGISDNGGGVKRVATTLPHALEQERHFALIGEVLNATKARFLISIQVEAQFDPCISSVTSSIMITTSNSSVKRSGLPTQLLGVLRHTIACSELARVRTELFDGS